MHNDLYDVLSVRVEAPYFLHLEFDNGERRVFDMTPFMFRKPFDVLKDSPRFFLAFTDYGAVVWPGDIDISPETLYDLSVLVE